MRVAFGSRAGGEGRKTMPFIRRFFQAVAWALAAAIIFLSIGPASTRPVTGAGHNFEHLMIFLAMGMAFGLGYPCRFRLLFVAMFAFSGAVEIAQIMVPGRHARLSDFVTDAAASCLGVGLSYGLSKLIATRAEKN